MTFQFEDMPEGGRLARAAVALVSACGLVGEGHEYPSLSSGIEWYMREGVRDRTWVTWECD